jgi:4-hydroxy-tetrahydrodipicolinate reductase
MTLRLAVAGAAGRMGREIAAVAGDDPTIDLVGGVVRPGSPASVPGVPLVGRLEELLPSAGVVIDFTTPAATAAHARLCAEAGCAFVSGVTGLGPGEVAALEDAARRTPVFYARNLSLGLATILEVLPGLAWSLAGYDVEVVETHHRHKQDAPSGTALALAEAVAGATGATLPDDAVFGRRGQAPRAAGELGLHAVRSGGNPGEHVVLFADEGEEIRIAHRAFSRRTYALGAVRAAHFLAGRPPGLYGMADLLASLSGAPSAAPSVRS